MKKIYRKTNLKEYWDNRWTESKGDKKTFENINIYPIKYAEWTLTISEFLLGKIEPKILECGFGLGRVLKHYDAKGYDICGFDNNITAVEKVRKSDKKLKIMHANAKLLPYPDNTFDIAFAFGVFHNLEEPEGAVKEVLRCMKKGGLVCFSFPAQNFGTWLRELGNKGKCFYKWHFTEKDVNTMMKSHNLMIFSTTMVENIPILYKFNFLRKHKTERQNRTKGYELNRLGGTINKLLVKLFPRRFKDTIIIVGRKLGDVI